MHRHKRQWCGKGTREPCVLIAQPWMEQDEDGSWNQETRVTSRHVAIACQLLIPSLAVLHKPSHQDSVPWCYWCRQHFIFSSKYGFSVNMIEIIFISIWYIWTKETSIPQRSSFCKLEQCVNAKCSSCWHVQIWHVASTHTWCHTLDMAWDVHCSLLSSTTGPPHPTLQGFISSDPSPLHIFALGLIYGK